ncbi:hypothetical protein RRF57_006793 [Xylaria bambusicola]|uniref:Uncharacterized protein n=1 Tax=Xylaria bambusicola TaxID=326684 RepID=A0AAN7UJV6_9PEZI
MRHGSLRERWTWEELVITTKTKSGFKAADHLGASHDINGRPHLQGYVCPEIEVQMYQAVQSTDFGQRYVEVHWARWTRPAKTASGVQQHGDQA